MRAGLRHGSALPNGHGRMTWLFDPKVFNYLIMSLYCLNSGRWALYGSWPDVCYWLSAFAITATVTFGYEHG